MPGGTMSAGPLPGPGQEGVGLAILRCIQQAGHGEDQQGEADAQDHLQGRLLRPEGGQRQPQEDGQIVQAVGKTAEHGTQGAPAGAAPPEKG